MVAVVTALAVALAAEAQPPAKASRIGWLWLSPPGPEVLRVVDAFKEGLRQLGYTEGQTFSLEYRWAHGQGDRLPDLAAELVRLKVDVILVGSTPAAVAARQATSTIPIVIPGTVSDPLGQGLVASLRRPGGNVTGVAMLPGPEIAGKYLEILRETVPELSLVAVLWNPTHQAHRPLVKEVEAASRILRVRLQLAEARTAEDFGGAFSAMARARVDGVIVIVDPNTFVHRDRLAELAVKHRLPTLHGLAEGAVAGGLMAYSPNLLDAARRAATHVDKILRGARPGDLPVEQPTKLELVVNLRTARALGLTIPPAVLFRADRVIE
jgi:putative ABC transport system substrate-binding protein